MKSSETWPISAELLTALALGFWPQFCKGFIFELEAPNINTKKFAR
jgi:hypothetical protein